MLKTFAAVLVVSAALPALAADMPMPVNADAIQYGPVPPNIPHPARS